MRMRCSPCASIEPAILICARRCSPFASIEPAILLPSLPQAMGVPWTARLLSRTVPTTTRLDHMTGTPGVASGAYTGRSGSTSEPESATAGAYEAQEPIEDAVDGGSSRRGSLSSESTWATSDVSPPCLIETCSSRLGSAAPVRYLLDGTPEDIHTPAGMLRRICFQDASSGRVVLWYTFLSTTKNGGMPVGSEIIDTRWVVRAVPRDPLGADRNEPCECGDADLKEGSQMIREVLLHRRGGPTVTLRTVLIRTDDSHAPCLWAAGFTRSATSTSSIACNRLEGSFNNALEHDHVTSSEDGVAIVADAEEAAGAAVRAAAEASVSHTRRSSREKHNLAGGEGHWPRPEMLMPRELFTPTGVVAATAATIVAVVALALVSDGKSARARLSSRGLSSSSHATLVTMVFAAVCVSTATRRLLTGDTDV